MDRTAVRAAYDWQVRRRLGPGAPGEVVERTEGLVTVRSTDGWNAVLWSDLDASTADQAIAGAVARFRAAGAQWEWKHYSDDQPADLPERLLLAGLRPGARETLMVADLGELTLDATPPQGIRLVPVVDDSGVQALVQVHDEVFGGEHAAVGRALAAGLGSNPPTMTGAVALAGDVPVSAGRLELFHGTDFASIWGGGTLPQWRGRGVFRALVAHRAALAADAGFRYLQVDATADSRPILRRLGFVELATTTPFTAGPDLA